MQRVSRASTQSVVYSSRSHRIIRERERDHPAKMPRHIKNNWNGYVEKNGRRLTAAVSGERRVSDAVFSYYIHDEPEREREREIIHNSSQVHQVTSRNKKKTKTKIAPTVWVRYGPVAIQTEGKTTSSWFPSTTPRFFSFNQGRIGEPAANNQLRRNSLKSPPNSPTRHNKLLDGRILVWFLMFRA